MTRFFTASQRLRRLLHALGLLLAVGGGSLPLTAIAQPAGARPWSWATPIEHPTLNGVVHSGKTATDAAGNQYLTGSFAGTVAFGATTLTSRANAWRDLFVAKLSPTGQWLWAVSPAPTTVAGLGYRTSQGLDVAVDPQGTVVVLGTYSRDLALGGVALPVAAPYTDALLVARLSGQGQWLSGAVATTPLGNPPAPIPVPGYYPLGATNLALDAQGNAYVLGLGPADITFGTIPLVAPFGNDTQQFVASVGANGQWRWANVVFQRGEAVLPTQLAAGPQGDVWIAGTFQGAATFGSTTLTSTVAGGGGVGTDLFLAHLNAGGQWQGAYAAGGRNEEYLGAVAVDAQNNVYVTGAYRDSAAFGAFSVTSPYPPDPFGSYNGDAYLAKLGANGQWAWVRSGGGVGRDWGQALALDPLGEVYWTGQSSNAAVFGATTLSFSSRDFVPRFFAKVSAAGQWRWAVGANLGADWDGTDLAPDPLGGVRVASLYGFATTLGATALASPPATDVLAARLTAAGQWDWTSSTATGGTAVVQQVVSDAQGTTYATGAFGGTVVIGTTTLTSRGFNDGFVACLNRQGQPQWAVQLGTRGDDGGQRIALDPRGGVVVSGMLGDTLVLGADVVAAPFSPYGYYGYYGGAGFVARLSAQGQVLGGSRVPPFLTRLAVTGTGDAVMTGTFTDTLRFGSAATLVGSSWSDVFVARLSAANQWQWVRQISGSARGQEAATDLVLDAAGHAYTLGTFTDTLTIAGSTLVQPLYTGASYLGSLDGATGQWRWVRQVPTIPSIVTGGLALAPGGTHLLVAGTLTDSVTFGSVRLGPPGGLPVAFVAELSLAGQGLGGNRADGPGSSGGGPVAGGAPGTGYVLGGVNGVARFGTDSVSGPWRIAGPGEPLPGAGPNAALARPLKAGPGSGAGIRETPGRRFERPSRRGGPPLPSLPTPFVAGFTGAGQWQWAQIAHGANSLAANSGGDLFLAGSANPNDSTLAAGGFSVPAGALAVGFVSAMLDGPLGLTDIATARPGLTLWPNPAHRTVRFSGRPVGATAVRLLDGLGREVFRWALAPTAGPAETLALPGLAPGLYLVECGVARQRLMVE